MRLRVTETLLGAVCAVLILMLAATSAQSNQAKPADDEIQLTKLLTERRDTIQKHLDMAKAFQSGGRKSINNVIHVQDKLHLAELALAKSKLERVHIQEQRVANFRRLEDTTKRMVEVGIADAVSLLEAKEQRLAAEIDLYKTKVAGK